MCTASVCLYDYEIRIKLVTSKWNLVALHDINPLASYDVTDDEIDLKH